MINLNINGIKVKAEAGRTVLEAALAAGIYIPNLCYHPDIPPIGACRLCIVEIDGVNGFPTACTTTVKEGMVVRADTPKIQELRKNIIWLILSEHPKALKESSQLKKVVEWIGVKELLPGFIPRPKGLPLLAEEPLFAMDLDRCILCGRCVSMCQEIRGVGAIGFINRGINTIIGTNCDLRMRDSGCKFCLACVEVCPTGALIDKEEFEERDREKTLLPCKDACPAGIDIPRYIRLIAEGKFQDSIEVVRQRVTFPYVLGCVCHHPCEEVCRRTELNEPMSIRELKRFVAERDSGRWRSKLRIASETGKKVAVVGSGPAGLTAAWFLRKSGHSVTVFEALPAPGGMMKAGIPEYRLPTDILNREIKDIENIGVKIKLNTEIKALEKLFSHGFSAVFLALGAHKGIKMGIPGENGRQVLDGISMLKSIKFGKKVDIAGEVAVVGGGNVAVDAARSALRTGAKKVTILYRRTQKEMPAYIEEVEEALKEGVKISFLTTPIRVLSENNKLKVECIRMKLGEPDSSGRRRPIPIEGSEFIIKLDRLIVAIGQRSAVPKKFALALDGKGRIKADEETLACSMKGVFAGGDVVSGAASVIEAIEAGRKASISIDKYLGGTGQIDQKFIPEEEDNPCLGRDEEFAYKKRAKAKFIPLSKKLHGFSQVEYSFDEKTAQEEAKRCLNCQLRLRISKAPLPPK
ncbi:MAG: 4Fe-4S dicluster domain-containing protein [Dehalococcoidia bacterium]|nr:MAG: 4Fe-4S dicluster domain-containing protein [Dehalococcoidia bacterium]